MVVKSGDGKTFLGLPTLPPVPGRGRLAMVKMPSFQPRTDLLYRNPTEDDPDTPDIDESRMKTKETWAKEGRPFLVNMGGNRVTVIDQPLWFDATPSQGDDDAVPTAAAWDFGDSTTATGLTVRHSWSSAGTYAVTCTIAGTTSTRYVRVLTAWGESDFDITGVSLSAQADSGWQMTANVSGKLPAIAAYQGVILYVYDDLDLSWRELFEARMRDLSRRTGYTDVPGGDPIWDEQVVTIGSTGGTSPAAATASGTTAVQGSLPQIGDPTGEVWSVLAQYDASFLQYGQQFGVPPNLLKALAYMESAGAADLVRETGNSDCPLAYGLLQLAPGCGDVAAETAETLLDPLINIRVGAQQLATLYNQCGTWPGTICAFFSGNCTPDGTTDDNGMTDETYVSLVQAYWRQADAAIPPVGGGIEGPIYGEGIFSGYIRDVQPVSQANTEFIQLQIVNTGAVLDELSMRAEYFFENATAAEFGGTVVGVPLRTATAMHHLLAEHTNFTERHDVVLDWSGPRFWSTTAAEGKVWSNIQAWAGNDFAHSWTDRRGRVRYEPKPSYRGQTWFNEAINYALWVDPTLVLSADVQERRIGNRVVYAKLCGMTSNGQCEMCSSFPCTTPSGKAGQWATVRGLQYDDYTTLCTFAAHHYAYMNRRYDVTLTMPWRHDLEIHDLVRLPLKDKSGRFDWARGTTPLFTVVGISHQFDLARATWISTVNLEEVTYGVPCDCPQPHCAKTIYTNGDGTSGGGGTPGGGGSTGTCFGSVEGTGWNGYHYEGGLELGGGGEIEWELEFGAGNSTVSGSTIDSYGNDHANDVFLGSNVIIPRIDGLPASYRLSFNGQVGPSGLMFETNGAFEMTITDNDEEYPLHMQIWFGFNNQGGSPVRFFDWTAYDETGDAVDFATLSVNETRHMQVEWNRMEQTFAINCGAQSAQVTGATDVGSGDLHLDFINHGQARITNVFLEILEGGDSGSGGSSPLTSADGYLHPAFEISAGSDVPTFDYDIWYYDFTATGSAGSVLDVTIDVTGIPDSANAAEGQGIFEFGLFALDGGVDGSDGQVDDGETSPAIRRDGALAGWETVSQFQYPMLEILGQTGRGDQLFHSFSKTFQVGATPNGFTYRIGAYGYQGALDGDPETVDGTFSATITFGSCQDGGGGWIPPGDGGYPPYDPTFPVGGTCAGWPTVEKINYRIGLSESANGRTSVIHNAGSDILALGKQYGINPGVVVAIMQRESQLACDGSYLPTKLYNFGGLTAAPGNIGPCGEQFYLDRQWKRFCTAYQGLEGMFKTLDSSLYRNTGGSFINIMNLYSPQFENDWVAMWNTFRAVGDQLGIILDTNSNIYDTSEECTGDITVPQPPSGPGYGGYTTMLEWSLHQVGSTIAQGPFGSWSHSICDCYDFGAPIGTPMYSPASGTVILSEATSGVYTPNTVVVRTSWGDLRFGHFSQRNVSVGQIVGLDTLLGYSGTAGTGPHLHLGLEGGRAGSPVGYSLTEILGAVGFNLAKFPWSG